MAQQMREVVAMAGVKSGEGQGSPFQASVLLSSANGDIFVLEVETCWNELQHTDIEDLLEAAVTPESCTTCGPFWGWVVTTVRDLPVARADVC